MTVQVKTLAAQRALLQLASVDIDVQERRSGSGAFQLWLHSPAIDSGRGGERLYALIEELYPELVGEIVVGESPA